LSSRSRLAGLVLGSALLLGCVLASLGLGARPVPVDDVLAAFLAFDGSPDQIAVRALRLPRTVVALLVGVALGVAGVLMQGLTRNPVADPGLLGVSAGAALGVVAAVTLMGVASAAGYVWFALVGALVAGLAVFYVSARSRRAPVTTLVLAGAAVSTTLGSVSASILAVDQQTLDQYRFWAVGSLQGRELPVAVALAPVMVCGLLLAAVAAPGLDAVALGDDVARTLGRKVGLTYLLAGTSVVVLTGAAVAAAGPIAFVGLVVPHLVRPFAGARHGWLLLYAALCAPALVLAADVLGRLVVRPAELPVGIVLALVGAPFLIWMVRRDRARGGTVRAPRREVAV
jgi:iron complex transport system permease protein